ncbi:MAG: sugar ABC transporter permease [Lachnospiraceae bacterium]|nr:sugar ABC transporter permease [Lachnospiraceae bacterium]
MKKNRTMLIVFLLPATLCYILVFLYPTIRSIIMSFFKVGSATAKIAEWEWVGIGNYQKLMNAGDFVRSMSNIGKIWLIGGISVMLIALLFAVILTSGIKLKSFYRAMIYLPNVISAVAMGNIWVNFVFDAKQGLLTKFFGALGLETLSKIQWTGKYVFWAMLIAYCFGMVGYHMLIFMSGIERIPTDFYEAATIDGANKFKQFTSITLPLLKGVVKTNLVMWTVSITAFFVWSQIFSPNVLKAGTISPIQYLYVSVFGGSTAVLKVNAGLGAAVGVLMALCVLIVFVLTSLIFKEKDLEF